MDLGAIVAERLDGHSVAGAVVGVVDADGVARVVTGGTRGDGRGAVDNDTVFAAASLSKPVFASGVMSLIDAGALELDRPLADYVAEPIHGECMASLGTFRMLVLATCSE